MLLAGGENTTGCEKLKKDKIIKKRKWGSSGRVFSKGWDTTEARNKLRGDGNGNFKL